MQKITAKNFTIHDERTINFMRTNNIDHLRFISSSVNDESCLLVKYPDYKNELTLGKQWMKVSYGKRKVCIRTPSVLKSYIGKDVKVYEDNILSENFELFRIVPIEFEIKELSLNRNKRIVPDVPYFSQSSYLVIPNKYIRRHGGTGIFNSKLSFNRTDSYVLDSGYMFCRIFHDNSERGNLIYSLSKCTNGARARINKLSKIVADVGKDLRDFQYEATIFDDNKKYDLIIFKEVVLDEP